MKALYYLVDPNGDKIGPVDIVELTRWARDGKILPENTIADEEGNTCNARDIISFIKITPKEKKVKEKNVGYYLTALIIMSVISALCVVAYMGMRANYEMLKSQHINLKNKYETLEEVLEKNEKDNMEAQQNAAQFIQRMVNKYNMMESEKEELNNKLNSVKEQNKALMDLKEALGEVIKEEKKEESKEETPKNSDIIGIPMPEDL